MPQDRIHQAAAMVAVPTMVAVPAVPAVPAVVAIAVPVVVLIPMTMFMISGMCLGVLVVRAAARSPSSAATLEQSN